LNKECRSCKLELDISCFSPSKSVRDGFENTCRKCRLANRAKQNLLTCKVCNKEFFNAKKNTKFCSATCFSESRRIKVKVNCAYCEKDVYTIPSKVLKFINLYCNRECRTKHKKILMLGDGNPNYNRVDALCSGCGIDIKIQPYRLSKHKYHFCTKECFRANFGKFFIGEDNSKYKPPIICKCITCGIEFKRKQSEIKSDRVFCSHSCYLIQSRSDMGQVKLSNFIDCTYCGKLFHSTPSQQKVKTNPCCSSMCAAQLRSEIYVGSNHARWDPNKSDEERISERSYPAYRDWRVQVFTRDNFECKCCGNNQGGNLIAHHIYNYSEYEELRTCVDNGTTLCAICHKEFHDIYGYTKNNEEQLTEYFLEISA